MGRLVPASRYAPRVAPRRCSSRRRTSASAVRRRRPAPRALLSPVRRRPRSAIPAAWLVSAAASSAPTGRCARIQAMASAPVPGRYCAVANTVRAAVSVPQDRPALQSRCRRNAAASAAPVSSAPAIPTPSARAPAACAAAPGRAHRPGRRDRSLDQSLSATPAASAGPRATFLAIAARFVGRNQTETLPPSIRV